MEIAFFTEMGFTGKIPRTHENMRTEFAWMVALNATHYPIDSAHQISYETKIDLGIKYDFNFLTVAQMGPRKNLFNTIKWFVEEFKKNPNTTWIMKPTSRA